MTWICKTAGWVAGKASAAAAAVTSTSISQTGTASNPQLGPAFEVPQYAAGSTASTASLSGVASGGTELATSLIQGGYSPDHLLGRTALASAGRRAPPRGALGLVVSQ